MSKTFGRVSVWSAGMHGMRINVDMPPQGIGEESALELARDLSKAIAHAWPDADVVPSRAPQDAAQLADLVEVYHARQRELEALKTLHAQATFEHALQKLTVEMAIVDKEWQRDLVAKEIGHLVARDFPPAD